jgi:uncharacterized repeat protein (TIGR01451 family)
MTRRPYDGRVYLMFGDGRGGFRDGGRIKMQPAPTKLADTAPTDALAIISSDFNRDGRRDIAVLVTVGHVSGYVGALYGQGDGTFLDTIYTSVDNAIDMDLAYSDMLGEPAGSRVSRYAFPVVLTTRSTDWVGRHIDGYMLFTYIRCPSGPGATPDYCRTFEKQRFWLNNEPALDMSEARLRMANVSGDGEPEIVVVANYRVTSGTGPAAVFVYRPLRFADYDPTPAATFLLPYSEVKDVGASNFTGDGFSDIAVAGRLGDGRGRLDVFFGNPDTARSGPSLIHTSEIVLLRAADTDLLGRDDIIAATYVGPPAIEWTRFRITSSTTLTSSPFPIGTQTAVAVNDFNNDGRPDIAGLNQDLLTGYDQSPVCYLNRPPNLSITKRAEGQYSAGGYARYTVTVRNLCPGAVTPEGLTITDSLPTATTWSATRGAGWTCTTAGFVLTCRYPSLPPGGAASLEVSVGVPAAAPPQMTNIVTVAGRGDYDVINNRASAMAFLFYDAIFRF